MMKKVLSFLLALVMVLSMLPGTVPALEASAEAADNTTVQLHVQPASVSAIEADGVYTWVLDLSLSASKALTMGSLQFYVSPAEGYTYAYNGGGVLTYDESAVAGKILATYLYDAEALQTVSADAPLALGSVTITKDADFAVSDALLPIDEQLFGVYDTDAVNGVTYVPAVIWPDHVGTYVKDCDYTACGHSDSSVVWTPLDDAAMKALTKDNVVNNAHYYLTEDVTMANTFTANGFKDKTFTICLNGHDLKGSGTNRLFRIESGVNLTICDCQKQGTISNPKTDGTGWSGSDGNLIGLVSGASTVTLQDVKLDGLNMVNGTSSNGGGALYMVGTGSVLTIENCEISGFAHKLAGGAILVNVAGNLKIDNVTFKDNTTPANGGAIAVSAADAKVDITNSTFEQNAANQGGAIFMNKKATLNITNTTFKDNSATSYDGAVFGEYGTTTMTGCTFTGNKSTGSGPSVTHVANGGTMKLYGCTITGNKRTGTSKTAAGALQVRGTTSYLYVGGATVIRHNTDIDGKERNITFARPFDTTNKKNALYVDGLTDGADISIDTYNDDSTVMAFFTRDDANTLVIATNKQTDWNENWISYDQKVGAHIGRTESGFVYLDHSHADMADATWQAWGDSASELTTLPTASGNYYLVSDINMTQKVYMTTENNVVLCLNGHNVRGVSGDATAGNNRMWHMNAGAVSVCDCTATRDAQGNLKAGTLYPGSGVDGGLAGLYINGNDPKTLEFTMKDVIIDGENTSRANTAIAVSYYNAPAPATGKVTVANISGCEFRNYVTTSGNGMIHVLPNNKLNVTDTKFVNNTAKRGAAIASFAGIVDLKNCTFENNRSTGTGSTAYPAYYGGGAIYSGQGSYTGADSKTVYVNTSALTVENCSFIDNSAVTTGGAIYTYYGSATIINSTFADNTAENYYGGAILTNQSTVNISGSTFTDNVADEQGGAIYLNYGTNTITGTTFTGNEAKTTSATSKYCGGGAIFTIGKLTATDCVFNKNISAKTGAAIYSSYSSTTTGMTLTRCTFAENVAGAENTVFITAKSTNTMTDCVFTGNVSHEVGASAVNNEGSSTLTLDSCTITGNTAYATGEAGATYTSGTSALILKGDTVIKNNYQSNGTERNVIIKKATDTATTVGVGMLNVNGLTAGADVKVFTSTSNVRATAAELVQTYPTNGTQTDWDADWIRYENNGKAVDRVDGVYVFATAHIAEVDGEKHVDLSDALTDAVDGEHVAKVLDTVNEAVTVPAGATAQLDLNGNTIGANAKFTSTGASTLHIVDSKLSYDSQTPTVIPASAIGEGVTIPSSYKVGNSRYVAIEQNDGSYQIHRVQLTVTAKALRTSNNGIGFKVKFSAAESIKGQVTDFGIKFTVKNGDDDLLVKDLKLMKDDYMDAMVNGQELTIVLADLLEKDSADNETYANCTIEGTPYIEISNGVVDTQGATISANYKDMFEYANTGWGSMTKAQKDGLANMYKLFGSVMTGWSIKNISDHAATLAQQ